MMLLLQATIKALATRGRYFSAYTALEIGSATFSIISEKNLLKRGASTYLIQIEYLMLRTGAHIGLRSNLPFAVVARACPPDVAIKSFSL